MSDLPWTTGSDPANLGAPVPRKCRRHEWRETFVHPRLGVVQLRESGPLPPPPVEPFDRFVCAHCSAVRDPAASRRGRANGNRGRRAELTIAREIDALLVAAGMAPRSRKMGPLGLPWDVEVGEFARLQVKKLVSRPSTNAIRKLIEAIPNTGDRLRGFVWVEAAGQGKRGRREVTFLTAEFAQWHGGDFGPGNVPLVTLPLADWIAEFVGVMVVVAETQP